MLIKYSDSDSDSLRLIEQGCVCEKILVVTIINENSPFAEA